MYFEVRINYSIIGQGLNYSDECAGCIFQAKTKKEREFTVIQGGRKTCKPSFETYGLCKSISFRRKSTKNRIYLKEINLDNIFIALL
jgi:hypothetical protein